MNAISALVLAAGESRRMGGRNKLLLPVQGKPLLRRILDTLAVSGLTEIVVVLGHARQEIAALADDGRVRLVVNERYRDGQMTSVEAGLGALSRPCDGVMVCLADQPLLAVGDIRFLMAAFAALGDRSILVPTYQGRRGNPVIFAYRHRASILGGGNLGCRHLIERRPDSVAAVEMENDHVVVDIDTPEDYRRVAERLARVEPSRIEG